MKTAIDLTQGSIRKGMLRFCLPLIAGNLLQQLYNVADTWVVGRYLGENALAAVGSSFSLLVLLTSMVLGLCMGSGVVFSQFFGQRETERMRKAMGNALLLCFAVCLLITCGSCLFLSGILRALQVPTDVLPGMREYLSIMLPGMMLTFAFNYMATVQRSIGNSMLPLIFLSVSTVLNIALDIVLVAVCRMGIAGAAWATVAAQAASVLGMVIHAAVKREGIYPSLRHLKPEAQLLRRICAVSLLTSLQQSVMNFGILMIQGLVNSFGAQVMAAFAVGVKIDAFAYAPAQDFAAGYATFISQNLGAGKHRRILGGIWEAFRISAIFCVIVSLAVACFAPALMGAFLPEADETTIAVGIRYLRTEGLCYIGIGLLFLFYATFRGLEKPIVSLWLTIISLGLRVLISYAFAPRFGVEVIWWSIPIGWAAADAAGFCWLKKEKDRYLQRGT